MRGLAWEAGVVFLSLLLPAVALAVPTYDKAVDQLLDQHYPQTVVNTLNSFGDSSLGFRMAGAPADKAAAAYIASEFRAMGLASVRQEGVPVDAWNLRGAWVRVGNRMMVASQYPGARGTTGAISAPIVYVGRGTATEYAGNDVAGKLVLVDLEFDDYWINFLGYEAKLHGAIGIVGTWGDNTAPYIANPAALNSDEARWSLDLPPLVYISATDGAWLKAQVATGPLSATVFSDVEFTMHDFAHPASGGLGFNVVGELRGTDPNAKAILIAAHHDAYFRAGLDDTAPVAQLLTIAKAMKTSGVRLRRPVIFLVTTGEEFGYTNTEYDYLAGAWYAATVTHASTAARPAQRWTGPKGRVALMMNIEEGPMTGARLYAGATPELRPWWRAVAKSSPSLLPYGYEVASYYTCWQDGWPFAAAGVPGFVTVAETEAYQGMNHTSDDTSALVDYPYLGLLAKFYFKLASTASVGLLPYDLDAQAANLRASVSRKDLTAAGADAKTVDAALAALKRYKAATAAYSCRKTRIPARRRAIVNKALVAIERYWHTHLTGLDAWNSYSIYPFEQTLWDVQYLKAAIAHLQADPVEKDEALEDLSCVALTANGMQFSCAAYARDLKRFLPDYDLANWGGQVNQSWRVDIMDEVGQVESGDYATAIRGLKAVVSAELSGVRIRGYRGRRVHIDGLNQRLIDMTTALNAMTPMVGGLR